MIAIRRTAVCLALTVSTLPACSGQPPARSATAADTAAATATSPPKARTVTGKVVETMDAASYTYIRVDTGSEEVWVATGRVTVAVGDRVVVPLEMPMRDFHSQALGRDFPLIYFVSSIGREGEQAEPMLPPGHRPRGGGQPSATAAPAVGTIEPAPGGTTVAKIWANRASLAGTRVVVRGKVVKFNGGILGRNWLHIQDGTGAAADGSRDLTITTAAMARVGEVVTVTGLVVVDKDFGAGYFYKVMLEDATVEVK